MHIEINDVLQIIVELIKYKRSDVVGISFPT